ncbi:phage minor head protein [Pseudomonas sp. FR229a]|uniref:phage head morphogenesis protein n=1 Tax=Pseudomonas sp. FR229a TaxID=3040313 RepID=UPI002556B7F2|nr:phage minor head protein [Pseudomonas sp. FR229a]
MAKHTLNPSHLQAIFGLEPANAIAYLHAKGYATTWHWQDLLDQAHHQAFTVAKVMRLDLLSDIRAALETALQQGQTLKQFTANLTPALQAQGWWGQTNHRRRRRHRPTRPTRQPVPPQNHLPNQPAKRLHAGRKTSMEAAAATHPHWMLVSIIDSKTRPSHRAMHGQVFHHDDPIWQTIYPPNGFNCRCRVIALTAAAVQLRGLTIQTSHGKTFTKTLETGVASTPAKPEPPPSPASA